MRIVEVIMIDGADGELNSRCGNIMEKVRVVSDE